MAELSNEVKGLCGSVEEALSRALQAPSVAKERTTDDLAKALVVEIKTNMVEGVSALLQGPLSDAFENHRCFEGERAESEAPGDWDAALAAAFEEVLEPHLDLFSAEWLSKAVHSAEVRDEIGVANLLLSAGLEVFKTAAGKRGGEAKFLSALGIAQTQLSAALSTLPEPAAKGPKLRVVKGGKGVEVVKDAPGIEALFDLYKSTEGAVEYNTLAWVLRGSESEAEAVLAPILGLRARAAAESIRHHFSKSTQADTAQEALGLVDSKSGEWTLRASGYSDISPATTPAVQEVKTRGGAGDPRMLEALLLLRETCAIKDEALAEGLGVSRQTVDNYLKCKTKFKPSEVHVQWLRDVVQHYKGKLADLEALLAPEA